MAAPRTACSAVTEAAGFRLMPRLPVYPEFIGGDWIDPGLAPQGARRPSTARATLCAAAFHVFVEGSRPTMTQITFLRLRPADAASTSCGRRRGVVKAATAVEVDALDHAGPARPARGRSCPGCDRHSAVTPSRWRGSSTPDEALELLSRGVPGWRLTRRRYRRSSSPCSMRWLGPRRRSCAPAELRSPTAASLVAIAWP